MAFSNFDSSCQSIARPDGGRCLQILKDRQIQAFLLRNRDRQHPHIHGLHFAILAKCDLLRYRQILGLGLLERSAKRFCDLFGDYLEQQTIWAGAGAKKSIDAAARLDHPQILVDQYRAWRVLLQMPLNILLNHTWRFRHRSAGIGGLDRLAGEGVYSRKSRQKIENTIPGVESAAVDLMMFVQRDKIIVEGSNGLRRAEHEAPCWL